MSALRKIAALTLAMGAAASPAGAQMLGGPGATHVFGPVAEQLAAVPTDADVMAAWPTQAKAKGLGGSAVMHCVADMGGALSDCRLMTERSHAGFGAALLSLAPKYRLLHAAEGKRPERADVIVTATWPAPDTPADWVTPPKPGDFSTTATPAAWRYGEPGTAVMNCLLAKLGALYDCMVVYQIPAGKGFGAMTLRFQGFLRLKPAQTDGKPIASGVDIVFTFRPLAAGETP
jgi:hypothetical protein